MNTIRFARTWFCRLSVLGLLGLAGCAAIGAAEYQANGPDPVDAKYTIKATDPMLVFVENYHGDAMASIDAQELSAALVSEANENKLAPLVDQVEFERLRNDTPDFSHLSIAEIGRKLKAKQILYVNLKRFELEMPPGGMIRGRAMAMVKVINADTGETLWPGSPSDGEAVDFDTPWKPDDKPNSQSLLRQELSMTEANHIGNLFHSWKPKYDMDRPGATD